MSDEVPVEKLSIEDRIVSSLGLPAPSAEVEASTETQEATPELAEIDVDGDLFQVPQKLKDAFMRNQDYTQKTQALAEKSKTIDHARELAQQSALDKTFLESVAPEQQEIAVIDAYLQQASKVDWSSMNTDQMLRQKVELDQIKERKANLKETLEGKRAKFNDEVKTRFETLRKQARDLASKSITGFNDQLEKEIRAFGVSKGLSEGEVDNVLLDPRSFSILNDAMQFSKAKAAAIPRDKQGKFLKPGVASDRTPQTTILKATYEKQLKSAQTQGQKARVIEDYLASRVNMRKQ
jgi:hypothetical protein